MSALSGNRYVDFVSDEYFFNCVKVVCDHYLEQKSIDMDWLQRNGLDSFKIIFDMMNSQSDLERWIQFEAIRQNDKTVGNWIGDFHQSLLGGVDGWKDLRRGHETGVDLMKEDETKFVELKNKHNTTKGENLKDLFTKLEGVINSHPGSTAYYAFITPKNGTSGDEVWVLRHRTRNPNIRKIWGSKVYELVTGKPDSLKKTWDALPAVINDVLGSKQQFSDGDSKKMAEIFRHALMRNAQLELSL